MGWLGILGSLANMGVDLGIKGYTGGLSTFFKSFEFTNKDAIFLKADSSVEMRTYLMDRKVDFLEIKATPGIIINIKTGVLGVSMRSPFIDKNFATKKISWVKSSFKSKKKKYLLKELYDYSEVEFDNYNIGVINGTILKKYYENLNFTEEDLKEMKNFLTKVKEEKRVTKNSSEFKQKVTSISMRYRGFIYKNYTHVKRHTKTTALSQEYISKYETAIEEYYEKKIKDEMKTIRESLEEILNSLNEYSEYVENTNKKVVEIYNKLNMMAENANVITKKNIDVSEAKSFVESEIVVVNAEKVNIKPKD
jgi:methyl-accepting chemotaxis protein